MIHIPVNVRSWLVNYIMDNQNQLEKVLGDEIGIFTPHDEEYASDVCDQWLPQAIERNIVPDIAVSMAGEYACTGNTHFETIFGQIPSRVLEKKKIRNELLPLIDKQSIFYPFSLTPLTMIYNSQMVDEKDLKHSWTDLFNPQYRIIFPERDKPLCRAVGAYLKANYPDEFVDFEKRVSYSGSPVSVGKALCSGEYDMAMTLMTFAEVAQNEIVAINKPQEGEVLMPQVITCKKGCENKVMPLIEILTSEQVQEYLEDQGVLTMRAGGQELENLQNNTMLSKWKDWNSYLSEIAAFADYKLQ